MFGVADVRFSTIDVNCSLTSPVLDYEIWRIDGNGGKRSFKAICEFIRSFFLYPYVISDCALFVARR